MFITVNQENRADEHVALRSMFEARKRVFVDLLKWDLPVLADRPLVMKRYPNGVEDKFFYEKRCPSHAPSWVQTAEVFSGRNEGNITFCLCQDLPTIVWLANLADLELHTPLARAPEMQHPTIVAFDLDPGPPATVVEWQKRA